MERSLEKALIEAFRSLGWSIIQVDGKILAETAAGNSDGPFGRLVSISITELAKITAEEAA